MLIKLWAYKSSHKVYKDDAEEFLEYNRVPDKPVSRNRWRESDESVVLPDKLDKVLDKMAFDLEGYRYDKERERIVVYTDFEYRLYIPAGEKEYIQFMEDVEMAMAHNAAYNCQMIAYYMDPDLSTFSSLNPFMHLIFRAFFH
ncbi:MAG: hypothetical protein K5989_10670 [Lachnospiraceae bacterium]|nr:hypothetical protein [Lachnospiraceae bacterium]